MAPQIRYTIRMNAPGWIVLLLTGGMLMASVDAAGTDKIQIFDALVGKVVLVDKVVKTDAQWKKILTPEQYEITTRQGTERPYTCTFEKINEEGLYKCVRCGTDLFRSGTKFESGTGWPSYYQPISELNVVEKEDRSLGMART